MKNSVIHHVRMSGRLISVDKNTFWTRLPASELFSELLLLALIERTSSGTGLQILAFRSGSTNGKNVSTFFEIYCAWNCLLLQLKTGVRLLFLRFAIYFLWSRKHSSVVLGHYIRVPLHSSIQVLAFPSPPAICANYPQAMLTFTLRNSPLYAFVMRCVKCGA